MKQKRPPKDINQLAKYIVDKATGQIDESSEQPKKKASAKPAKKSAKN